MTYLIKASINVVILIFTFGYISAQRHKNIFKANIYFHDNYSDTIFVKWSDNYNYNLSDLKNNESLILDKNNNAYYFSVKQKCKKYGYFYVLRKKRNEDVVGQDKLIISGIYPFFYGDSITIDFHRRSVRNYIYTETFSGVGSENYSTRRVIDSIYQSTKLEKRLFDTSNHRVIDPAINKIKTALFKLEQAKGKISNLAYELHKTDLVYRDSKFRLQLIKEYLLDTISLSSDFLKTHKEIIFKYFTDIEFNKPPSKLQQESESYTNYLFNKMAFLYELKLISKSNITLIDAINHEVDDSMKQKLFTLKYLKTGIGPGEEADFRYFLQNLTDSTALYSLQGVINGLPGSKLNDFFFVDSTMREYSLKDFEGKIILFDFWFTGCGACMAFYKNELSEVEKHFAKNPKIKFISVSIDRSKSQWIKSLNMGKYTSNHSLNLFSNGVGEDNEFIKRYKISSFPFLILINNKHHITKFNSPELYNKSSLIELIEELFKSCEAS